jgi:hypothetical protein
MRQAKVVGESATQERTSLRPKCSRKRCRRTRRSGDFRSRKTSSGAIAAVRWRKKGARGLLKATLWWMEAVNTEEIGMRLEDALKAESQNFQAAHHVIGQTMVRLQSLI